MPLETVCSSCSTKIKVKDELIGKSVKCPKCANVFKAIAETEAKTAVKASAGTAPKKPAAWDDPDDDDAEEKSAPWADKSRKGKADVKKAPAKKKAADEDDEDDDAPDEDAAFVELLEQTTLPEATKKQIKSDLGLREKGVWVGQPDAKIMTVRAIPKVLAALFALLVLAIILGVGGGLALEIRNILIYAVLVVLFLFSVLFFAVLIPLMDRRKAHHTAYVITNKRCIVYTGSWFMGPSVESFYPELLAHMRRMSSWIFGADAGDIVFRSVTTVTTTHHARGGTSTSVSTTYYGFLGIRSLDEIEQRIRDTLLRDDDDEEDEDERPRKKKKKRRDDDDD